jgi:hypothetical protein
MSQGFDLLQRKAKFGDKRNSGGVGLIESYTQKLRWYICMRRSYSTASTTLLDVTASDHDRFLVLPLSI